MVINRPAVVGAVVALVGHGVALGITMVVAVANGGGPNADLEAGGRLWVLMVAVMTYGIAQMVLLGVCIALRWRLGPRSSRGLVPGWLLGLSASIFWLCGGFSG